MFKDLLTSARSRRANSDTSGHSSDEEGSQTSSTGTGSHDNLFKGLILGSKYKKTIVASPVNVSSPALMSPPQLSTDAIEAPALSRSASETSLAEKYGKVENVIGRGGHAVVRLCCGTNKNKKYAVKEFRKRRKDETQKEYVKKLVAEFCISSSLDNPHVVKTVDLIQDEKHHWCVVMEFCSGGDLYSKIQETHGFADPNEINW